VIKNAVGFYWTLPVPWAGFTRLPDNIDDAAKASRTIRYQRSLITEFARQQGLKLVHEAAFLEIDPDRGSRLIEAALDKAAAICVKNAAQLLFVDFSAVQGWRSHGPMLGWLEERQVDHSMPIEASPVMMDGKLFDPHEHFSNWRVLQREWIDGKEERASQALARALELKAEGVSNPSIAAQLNAEGIPSVTGKPWSSDGLRKFLKACAQGGR
jgi:Recombinase